MGLGVEGLGVGISRVEGSGALSLVGLGLGVYCLRLFPGLEEPCIADHASYDDKYLLLQVGLLPSSLITSYYRNHSGRMQSKKEAPLGGATLCPREPRVLFKLTKIKQTARPPLRMQWNYDICCSSRTTRHKHRITHGP